MLSQKEVFVPFFPFCHFFGGPLYLHAFKLPSQVIFDFLSQRHNKLCHSISDIMDYSWTGKDQQQTNQPNDQADD